MIDLHTYVAGRMRSVKDGDGHILGLCQGRSRLLRTDAQVGFGHLRQCIQPRLEVSLISLELELKVGSQGSAVEGRYEDSLRLYAGVSNDIVWTLTEECKHTRIEQRLFDLGSRHAGRIHFAELFIVLFGSSLHHDAQHFAALAALHTRYYATYGRNKFHFGMVLVNKQGTSGHHILLFLNNHFRLYPREVVGNQRIEPRFLHRCQFCCSLTLQVNVKAFT